MNSGRDLLFKAEPDQSPARAIRRNQGRRGRMGAVGEILLTGATGLLGRYLLRDLLRTGWRVTVLVRPGSSGSGAERIDDLLDLWSSLLGSRLPSPVVLEGDLTLPGLGLGPGARAQLARRCQAVLHGAARIALRSTRDEPWRTNLIGTRYLAELCQSLGITEFHHISTAFVCGGQAGPIYEDELARGQTFHNDYEQSKYQAEHWLRQMRGLRTTVYRPSVIVGDSQTGYTSTYHNFYRFLELADRLATPTEGGSRVLDLRVPFTGCEPRNLVPVDWVSGAIQRILQQPRCHGETFHLVSDQPVSVRTLQEVAAAELGIDGVRWAGPQDPADPTLLEQLFSDHLREYWPYQCGDPVFDRRNTRRALPDWPVPVWDRARLARLVQFARENRWGRAQRRRSAGHQPGETRRYLEQFLPPAARRSSLTRLPLTVTVALDVRGAGGGVWWCHWVDGQMVAVHEDSGRPAEVTYRLDESTFADLVRGRQSPREAFFARRVEIEGHLEMGLKLAHLFEQFVREFPYRPDLVLEASDGCALLV
jgi:thioester reductase-like protein